MADLLPGRDGGIGSSLCRDKLAGCDLGFCILGFGELAQRIGLNDSLFGSDSALLNLGAERSGQHVCSFRFGCTRFSRLLDERRVFRCGLCHLVVSSLYLQVLRGCSGGVSTGFRDGLPQRLLDQRGSRRLAGQRIYVGCRLLGHLADFFAQAGPVARCDGCCCDTDRLAQQPEAFGHREDAGTENKDYLLHGA